MKKNMRYKSKVLGAIHETAIDLAEAGVMKKQTMKEFDTLCLTPVTPLTPDEIREIRLREQVS